MAEKRAQPVALSASVAQEHARRATLSASVAQKHTRTATLSASVALKRTRAVISRRPSGSCAAITVLFLVFSSILRI